MCLEWQIRYTGIYTGMLLDMALPIFVTHMMETNLANGDFREFFF